MRGTLSLREPDTGFLNRLKGHTFVRITIEGEEEYKLRHLHNLTSKTVTFILSNRHGVTIKEWHLKSTLKEASLLISESPPLTYRFDYNHCSATFITPSVTIQAALKPGHSTRNLELDGMKFQHKDFESIIHFRCPEEKLYTTIIVAYLIFLSPFYSND